MNATQVFGHNIRILRLRAGLSQEKLAERANLHRTYVGAVERAERNITLINAERLAKALGVELIQCLTEIDTVSSHD
jgi:transcriptional regulator with XRE-family HTH domain